MTFSTLPVESRRPTGWRRKTSLFLPEGTQENGDPNEGDFVVFYPGEVHKPLCRRRPGEGAQSGGEDADGVKWRTESRMNAVPSGTQPRARGYLLSVATITALMVCIRFSA